MSQRRIYWIALCAALTACDANSHDDDPPPPAAQTAPVGQPVAAPAAGAPGAAPTPPAAAPSAAPAAPQLLGTYELAWRQDSPTSPVEQMPAALISQFPGCIWARWGWEFMPDGGLTISNEMLCGVPPELGVGHGVCRAEFLTSVQWRQGGFGVTAPVRAQSRFVNLRQQPGGTGAFDTATVRCSVSIGAIQATLSEPVPGPGPSRPQEVTLVLADGTRMHLRAVDGEVNHRQIILDAAQ